MIGAIAGDMIGWPYERYPIKKDDFFILVAGFTDDTVLTVTGYQTVAVCRPFYGLKTEDW